MNCPHCGERIPDGSDFCIACGNEIGKPTATQQFNKTAVRAPLGADDLTDIGPSNSTSQSDSVFAQFMSDEAPKWDGETNIAERTGDTANLFKPLEDTYAGNDVEPMVYLPDKSNTVQAHERRKRDRAKKKVGVVFAAVAACVAAVAVVVFVVIPMLKGTGKAQATPKTEKPAAQQPVTTPSVEDAVVKVNVDVPDLGEEGSRVPLHVEGELRDGTSYAQDLFLMPGETNFRLPVGLYEVSVPASPINAEGYLYTYAEKTLLLAIGDDGTVTYDPNDFVFAFELKDTDDTTYADIDEATDWMLKDPERVGVAEELADKARAKVDEANKAKEAERQSTTESTTTNNSNNSTTDSTYNTNYSNTNTDSSDYSYSDDYNDSQDQQSSNDDTSSSGSSATPPTPIDGGGSTDSGSQTGGGEASAE